MSSTNALIQAKKKKKKKSNFLHRIQISFVVFIFCLDPSQHQFLICNLVGCLCVQADILMAYRHYRMASCCWEWTIIGLANVFALAVI